MNKVATWLKALFEPKQPAKKVVEITINNTTIYISDNLSYMYDKLCELKNITVVSAGTIEGVNVDWYYIVIKQS